MRSLGELAADYERWAAENEVIASRIMSEVSDVPETVRDEQLRQASLLTNEAEAFRHHAARLRASAIERIAMSLRSHGAQG
jgi:hypothetical protein